MATIKSYTDPSQSKKLAEILPLESADMVYRILPGIKDNMPDQYISIVPDRISFASDIPCWSLASLLGVLPDTIKTYCRLTIDKEGDVYNISYDDILSKEPVILYAEYSLIDACVEMVEKLNELKML